jgi:hypothetical protein
VHLLADLNRVKNRIEQLCQTGNVKVSSVATDLFGVSGRQMLKDLVEAQKDAGWMAKGKLQAKKRGLTLALEGTSRQNANGDDFLNVGLSYRPSRRPKTVKHRSSSVSEIRSILE